MSKMFIKSYGKFRITGTDFAPVESDSIRRIIFSPDNIHIVSIVGLRDGTILISNDSRVPFEFTLSRNYMVILYIYAVFFTNIHFTVLLKVMAVINYKGADSLFINSDWKLTKEGLENREIQTLPDLNISKHLNIDLELDGIGRADLKIDESGFACCSFTNRDLLFIRMNGNHAMPRFIEYIRKEINHSPISNEGIKEYLSLNPSLYKKIGKLFFRKWVQASQWGLK